MPKPIKAANHHWWPESLSKFWADEEGQAHQLFASGEIVRGPPAGFGAIRDAHRIKMAGPWDSTFESLFGRADTAFPSLVDWLCSLETSMAPSVGDLHARFLEQTMDERQRLRLAECVASLLARSPGTRNRIKTGVEFYRREYGLEEWQASKSLIASNQRWLYESYSSSMRDGGRFAILYTDSKEFIFGDGLLHNFSTIPNASGSLKCVCPLLPTVAVLFTRSLRYINGATVLTLRLDDQEVDFFNDVVQVYSKNYVLYRSQPPILTEAFRRGEHLEYQYHNIPWLDWIMHNVARYRHGGRTLAEEINPLVAMGLEP